MMIMMMIMIITLSHLYITCAKLYDLYNAKALKRFTGDVGKW